ncbi:MAG: helix-turn-helix transcriptional regulator [Clostridia bacterium]|nr:helix-turn-helix transcriptional regulator [Clostridia bacterium]
MKIGENLKNLRIQRNLSQEDVAKMLNISRQAYCRYENDQREISLDTLCKLADFYEETTDYILGRENSK